MLDNQNQCLLHEERIKEALSAMPNEGSVAEMANFFKALSEPSRLKILLALAGGELCVDHIAEAVGGNQSAVSHQLKMLKDNKLVKCRKDGQNRLYSLADGHIMIMIEVAKEHVDCHE